jgi:hypothetical protein
MFKRFGAVWEDVLGVSALSRVTVTGLVTTAIAVAASAFSAAPAPAAVGTLGSGAWCWFSDPRAIEVDDSTYVGWLSTTGAVVVAEYTQQPANAGDPVVSTAKETTDVVGWLYHDDHGSPSLLAEPDGRITVFFSSHNGVYTYYRTTTTPGEITAWGPVEKINSDIKGTKGVTYTNPNLLPAEDNKLYLFWRDQTYGQAYATRTVSGTWSAARPLIVQRGERPYLKTATNGSDTIGLAYTNGHPRETLANIYYAEYRHGWLVHANGSRIKPLSSAPIKPSQGDLVYDAAKTHVSAWVWDIAFDPRSRPVIVYATFPSKDNAQYWYANWTGHRWVSHFMTNAGGSISPPTIEQQYSGGITLDHSDTNIVYLSREVDGGFDLERWTTDDGGHDWKHTTVVPATKGVDNVRPVVPRGWTSGPMGVLWLRGDYGSYTTYKTAIAYLQ